LDGFQLAATLIALPESYSHIADSLLTNSKIEDLTIKGVHANILEAETRRKNDADPAANAIVRTARFSSSKKQGPRNGSCFKYGKQSHYANKCPNKGSTNKPAVTSPSPKDLDQDVKAWGKKVSRTKG